MSSPQATLRCCPWCGRAQVPAQDEFWRCPSCNLFVCEGDLVVEGEDPDLDAENQDYCPWCAYPMAREYSLPESGEFACEGCSGTLVADMLCTRAAIDSYRKRPLGGRGFLLFVLALLASLALAWWLLSA